MFGKVCVRRFMYFNMLMLEIRFLTEFLTYKPNENNKFVIKKTLTLSFSILNWNVYTFLSSRLPYFLSKLSSITNVEVSHPIFIKLFNFFFCKAVYNFSNFMFETSFQQNCLSIAVKLDLSGVVFSSTREQKTLSFRRVETNCFFHRVLQLQRLLKWKSANQL